MGKKKEVKVSENELFETPEFEAYLNELEELREDGESKIIALNNEIRDYKLNKQLDKDTRKKLIEHDKELIVKAKLVEKENKEKVKAIIKEVAAKAKEVGKAEYLKEKEIKKAAYLEAKTAYNEACEKKEKNMLVGFLKLNL